VWWLIATLTGIYSALFLVFGLIGLGFTYQDGLRALGVLVVWCALLIGRPQRG
jgi:hypothetical protein